jgi:hypothetical protein
MPATRVAPGIAAGKAGLVRPGTTIALVVLVLAIFAAAILQFLVLGRG